LPRREEERIGAGAAVRGRGVIHPDARPISRSSLSASARRWILVCRSVGERARIRQSGAGRGRPAPRLRY
jgi:hypothetical protein